LDKLSRLLLISFLAKQHMLMVISSAQAFNKPHLHKIFKPCHGPDQNFFNPQGRSVMASEERKVEAKGLRQCWKAQIESRQECGIFTGHSAGQNIN